MKYTLPENRSEITLEQYLKYVDIERRDIPKEEKDKRVFSLFTKIPYKKLGSVNQSDFNNITSLLRNSFNNKVEFVQRFKLNEIEYGFTPSLEDLTTDEVSDILTYQLQEESLHKLCAIFFREIKTSDKFGNYTIKEYDGTQNRSELFKQIPLSYVDGMVFFFKSLSQELKRITLNYSVEALKTEKAQTTTLKSGGGMLQDTK